MEEITEACAHLEYEDSFTQTIDEKVMTDMHLGNALNLDLVERFVNGKFESYPIFVSNMHVKMWSNLIQIGKSYKEKQVGMLLPTQKLLLKPSHLITIRQQLYKELLDLLGRALSLRKVNIPLATYYRQIISLNLQAPSLEVETFRFLLRIICMVSEATRGGSKSVYPGITIKGSVVASTLIFEDISYTFYGNNQFFMLNDDKQKISYYGTLDSMLLMLDTLGQRVCLRIGYQVASAGQMSGVPKMNLVNKILEIGDTVLYRYGNAGYEFIGLYEALIVSTLLRKNPDEVTDSTLFFSNCRQELYELIRDNTFGEEILHLFDLMSDLLQQVRNEDLSNLFCIYRIWGHPRVNIKSGMEKVYIKGTEQKGDPTSVERLILCQFRKMFLIEFYLKHHKYPPCEISKTSYISKCIDEQIPISTTNPGYIIWDFEHVLIKKLWELPETYDVCHILNDKAVSPCRSELFHSIKTGKGTVFGTQRRGIVRWLLNESIRCKSFLDTIDREGLDTDSLIIGMYEKEREIKIKARMFSLMSEKMRMYFVLTEELIAEHILRYFPQITMKDPLHVQIKKLCKASGISSADCLDPIVNIDFEKWNLNMRKELTYQLFTQLDHMFGYTNLINRTHDFFSKSYIYSCSGKYLPPIGHNSLMTDPPMAYIGHIGGFEGLRQKGWTLATVCLLSYIADSMKIKINLLGQGDNQVVRLYMPKFYWDNIQMLREDRVKEAKRILTSYIGALDGYFTEAGLPIKVRETWRSTRLYMYGKHMFMDGNSLPQWTKKLLRSYALSNEGTLTISGIIGTIATNMCAAAHASEKPDIMYALYLILGEWSLEYLFAYHPFTRKSIISGTEIKFNMITSSKKSMFTSGRIVPDYLIATILLIPTAVGGSVTIPLTGFIVRGFPDNASEGYTWLKLLASVPSRFQEMLNNWYSFLCNPTIEYDMLVQSPWALNHWKPPTPGLQSRDLVRTWILSNTSTKNSFIKSVGPILEHFDRKEICRKLIGEEVNPLILNEIYNSFPQVYLDQILRRVENTRTIKKLALKMDIRAPIITKLMMAENEFSGYLYWRCFVRGVIYSECATEHTRISRDLGWGIKIKGLTTPHPLEFMHDHICCSLSNSCPPSDYIYTKCDPNADFPPYLGSNVKTKVVSLQDIALKAEPLTSTSAKLFRYAKWLNLGPHSLELISRNMKVVCDTTIFNTDEELTDSFFSGSVEHRFNPATASEGCFINYAPQLGRSVFISSDCMPRYGKGQANYTLHFQAMYCWCQYTAASSIGETFLHYHLSCDKCIVLVDDKVSDVSSFTSILNNLYTECKMQEIRDTLGYLDRRFLQLEDTLAPTEYLFHIIDNEALDLRRLKEGIHILLATQAALAIMSSQKDTEGVFDSEDLQTFPRVYSFKISTVKIINLTAIMIILIKFARTGLPLTLSNIIYIRRKLIIQLTKMSSDKFKGLASLSLGRTWNVEESEEELCLNMGEYPEDTGSFLNAIKQNLIQIISETSGLKIPACHIQIPILGTTSRQQDLILLYGTIQNEECRFCWENHMSHYQHKVEILECPHKHISNIFRRIVGIHAPLDLAMKSLTSENNKVSKRIISGISETDMMYLFECSTNIIPSINKQGLNLLSAFVEQVKRNYAYKLPTSAIYKWDHIFAWIENIDFKHILVFGDGTGFTSLVAGRRFPNATIYPTAYLEKRKLIPQDLLSILPFASRSLPNINGALLQEVPDNILDDKWEKALIMFISKRSQDPILIVSDLEALQGNVNLITNLNGAICSLNNPNLIWLHKVYLHEWTDRPFLTEDFMVTPYANLHYGECFVSNISLGYKLPETTNPFCAEFLTSISLHKLSIDSLNRELCYPELRSINKTISMHSFQKNYVPISLKELNMPANVLVYKLLLHISGNFKAPYQGLIPEDDRRMLDGVLIRVIKGIKMSLLMLYGAHIKNCDYYIHLMVVRTQRKYRLPGLGNLQLSLSRGTQEIKITRKEEHAAEFIQKERYRLYGFQVQNNYPTTLEDLYFREIHTGKTMFYEGFFK
ncbi:TPA_asm: polyprotein [Aponogeton virus 1]|uniref:Replicase n=1 Tax=Aponogeton virus 1 TaxID=2977952 RepID=A0A9N6YJ97_9RHAB|nr:TPA_asm: polyprotein [Aponogeton virus 1]